MAVGTKRWFKIHWAWVVLGSSFATLFVTYSIRIGAYSVLLPEDGQSGIDGLPRRCHWDFPMAFWTGSFHFCDRRSSHRILKETERNLRER